MDQSNRIFGLDNWVSFLKDKPLPVMAGTVQQLNQLLQDPNLALNRLIPICTRDPVFTLHLCRLANRLNKNADTQVNSVELAIATLGLNHIIELCRSLPVIKFNAASIPHKQYFHAIDNSYHASVQARLLCRSSAQSQLNTCAIAALFYGVGHWALWRYAPAQMSQVKIGIYEQHKDVVLAENDVLGCTIQQISERLVAEWGLSDLAVKALKHSTSPDADMLNQLHRFADQDKALDEQELREIKLLLGADFYPVKLANWLALTVSYGWHQPKALRLLQIISDFLQLPEDKTSALLHQQCVQASREFSVEGLLGAAALLVLIPSDRILSYRLDGKSPVVSPPLQAEPASAATADALSGLTEFRDKQRFQEIIARLQQCEEYDSDKAVFTDLIKGLKLGLGLERVSIFSVGEDNRMLPLLQSGFDNKDPMRRFSQNLEVPSLFKRLTHSSKAVWMTPANRERIRAQLPERFKVCCNQQSFLMVSLFRQEVPIAMVYADLGKDSPPINDFCFKSFKFLCVTANGCLGKRSQPPVAT